MIVVLVVSIFVKIYMCFYNRNIGKKIDSAAMKATSMDSLSDSIATTVVLVCVVISKFTGINLDGYCGLLVALFILYAGFNAAKDTISPLLGQAPDPEFVKQIEEIVMSNEKIVGIHDLIVHDYGPGRVMVSLHAEVDGYEDIFVLHDIIDQVENQLVDKLYCEAVIHLDPIETNNETVSKVRREVEKKLKEINKNISVHDFRMVAGPTHTNLIFDVVEPYEMKQTVDEIKRLVVSKVKELDAKYEVVLHVDRSYIK